MSRLTNQHWKVLECIFQKDGFTFIRQKSSHRAYTKKGIARTLIIPTYPDVDRDIILSLMRTAQMSRERFFELLNKCK